MSRMSRKSRIKFGMIFITMIGAGCGHPSKSQSSEQNSTLKAITATENTSSNSSSTEAPVVDYAYVNKSIFTPYCIRCHSEAGHNKGGINLESYANVSKYLSKIKKEVLVEQAMPPSGPLNSDVSSILATWIAAGAPETVETTPTAPDSSVEPTTPVEPSTPVEAPTIDYSYVNANVIDPYCLSCHSTAGGNKGGLNFESYANVVKYIKKIKREAITEQAMPPSSPLPADVSSILSSWIDAGTPETVSSASR